MSDWACVTSKLLDLSSCTSHLPCHVSVHYLLTNLFGSAVTHPFLHHIQCQVVVVSAVAASQWRQQEGQRGPAADSNITGTMQGLHPRGCRLVCSSCCLKKWNFEPKQVTSLLSKIGRHKNYLTDVQKGGEGGSRPLLNNVLNKNAFSDGFL